MQREVAAKPKAYVQQRAFLKAFTMCGRVTEASRLARIDRHQHARWYKADAGYRVEFDEAQEAAAQMLEDEAFERAMGVKTPVLYKGKPVKVGNTRKILYTKEGSDQLLIMLLKRFRPALYRDNATVEHTGSVEIIERLHAGRQRLLEMRAKEDTA